MEVADLPVFQFRDGYQPESYWPEDYVADVEPVLGRLGWLTRPLTSEDRAVAARALEGLHEADLDETDVYPFGLLWALRSTNALRAVDGLDDQLRAWREWEETDHCEIPLDFLPPLPEPQC